MSPTAAIRACRFARPGRVESLTPLGVEEVEYRASSSPSTTTTPFSEEAVATAKALAARRRRAIHVLSLVKVPAHLPLDAELQERERAAQAKIERAKLICGQRVTGTRRARAPRAGRVRRSSTRRATIDAAAIVLPLRYRNGAPLYGKTVQTVLAKRPCRVIVSANPAEHADGVAALAEVTPAGASPADLESAPMAHAGARRGLPRRHPRLSLVILGFGITIVVVTLASGGGLDLVRGPDRDRVHGARRRAPLPLAEEAGLIDPFRSSSPTLADRRAGGSGCRCCSRSASRRSASRSTSRSAWSPTAGSA